MRTAASLVIAAILWVAIPCITEAQSNPDAQEADHKAQRFLQFAGGAIAGLGIHESGHLFFDVLFDADPQFERIEFGPIPFFAIEHTVLSPRREFIVSSAGFWLQHLSSEWLLTKRPELRHEHGPAAKGMLAFNVLTSIGYASVAFARAGPPERDTKGMADSIDVDERWVASMILVPALLDAWRYVRPEARWARWGSRAAKIVLVLLVAKSAD